jgi:hypothetical protein
MHSCVVARPYTHARTVHRYESEDVPHTLYALTTSPTPVHMCTRSPVPRARTAHRYESEEVLDTLKVPEHAAQLLRVAGSAHAGVSWGELHACLNFLDVVLSALQVGGEHINSEHTSLNFKYAHHHQVQHVLGLKHERDNAR